MNENLRNVCLKLTKNSFIKLYFKKENTNVNNNKFKKSNQNIIDSLIEHTGTEPSEFYPT